VVSRAATPKEQNPTSTTLDKALPNPEHPDQGRTEGRSEENPAPCGAMQGPHREALERIEEMMGRMDDKIDAL
jgi:hypothetical protein